MGGRVLQTRHSSRNSSGSLFLLKKRVSLDKSYGYKMGEKDGGIQPLAKDLPLMPDFSLGWEQ